MWPRVGFTSIDDNAMLRQLWPHFAAVYGASLIRYRHLSPFHHILMKIKYHGHVELAESLGQWGARELRETALREWADVVVPVPLSRWRQFRRGYNQAEIIARGVAREYSLPMARLLHRREGRTSQTHLSAQERLANAQDLYSARIPRSLLGSHILLVDDVMTTGATLTACALALLEADPSARISVFTLALSG